MMDILPSIYCLFMFLTFCLASLDPIDKSKCGKDRGCIGIPENCVKDKKKTCEALVAFYKDDSSKTKFQMETTNEWVAVGFSPDGKMYNSPVIECIQNKQDSGSVIPSQSYNQPKTQRTNSQVTNGNAGFTKTESEYKDGKVRCKVTRQNKLSSSISDFAKYADLTKERYLIIATGSVTSEFNKAKHVKTWSSETKVDVRKDVNVFNGAATTVLNIYAYASVLVLLVCKQSFSI